MTSKSPRWGLETGYQSRIKTHNPNITFATHGLKGSKADGQMSISKDAAKRAAREDAMDGIPAPNAATPDQWSEREQDIAAEADDMRRGLRSWFAESSGSVRNFIQDCTPAEINPETLQEAIRAEENEYRHYELDDVTEAKADHDASVVELAEFKSRHQKRIGNRTPDIKKNVEQTLAILLFMLILEGCFNALLFKDTQANGLMGGLMVAFGMSAINVTLGVCAGFWGLRYLNHPEKPFRIVGGVVAGIFITMGVVLNLFVAHFRDAVEVAFQAKLAEGSVAGFSMFQISPALAFESMFPNPLNLHSLVAFGLLAIGLGIFAIAIYEGYDKLSDRYPGYGRVWRKERAAYEKRQTVRNSIREDLGDYFTACRTWMDRQQQRHAEAKREIEKSINWLELRREQAHVLAERVGDQERGLKIAYRQANQRERNNCRDTLGDLAVAPAYFDEIITPIVPEYGYAKERAQADEAIKTIELNMQALTIVRQWLDIHIQSVQSGLSSVEKKVVQLVEEQRNSPDRKSA